MTGRDLREAEMYGAAYLEKRRRRRRKNISRFLAWMLVFFIVAVVIVSVVIIVRAVGGRSLRKNVQSNLPHLGLEETAAPDDMEENATTEPVVVWQEGWVRHNGRIYEYNEDIMTFLVMGIDKMGTVKQGTTGTDGGQSDALFLVIVNPDKKDINILAVNRDTMTTIEEYGMGAGGTSEYVTAQLAVQHGFGDGLELSCELTKNTVSRLFYDLPIHGYVSINMGAIPQINDAVGGVEVTVLEDLTKKNKKWIEGAQVTLKGEDAFWYVKWRDTTSFESARRRLARQKQYLEAFAAKAMAATRQDITLPVTLYRELSKYMVTDISVDEVVYLVGELLDYQLAEDFIHTMEGTTVQGDVYEEFYPDEGALREQMIELFYQEVEQ